MFMFLNLKQVEQETPAEIIVKEEMLHQEFSLMIYLLLSQIYRLKYRVFDDKFSNLTTVVIHIMDVNDNPPRFDSTIYNITDIEEEEHGISETSPKYLLTVSTGGISEVTPKHLLTVSVGASLRHSPSIFLL